MMKNPARYVCFLSLAFLLAGNALAADPGSPEPDGLAPLAKPVIPLTLQPRAPHAFLLKSKTMVRPLMRSGGPTFLPIATPMHLLPVRPSQASAPPESHSRDIMNREQAQQILSLFAETD